MFSGPIAHLLSVLPMLCVLMKILSYASAKKNTKMLKGFKFGTFIARFERHHGSEGVMVKVCRYTLDDLNGILR